MRSVHHSVVAWACFHVFVPLKPELTRRVLLLAFQKLHSRIMDLSAADLLLEPERSKAFLLSRNTDSPSNVSLMGVLSEAPDFFLYE